MKYASYNVICEGCGGEYSILVDNTYDIEPEYCPFCGESFLVNSSLEKENIEEEYD